MSWHARLPPAVNDLLQRLGIEPDECTRADGRFTIHVEDCGTIDLIPAAGQRLVLDAVIASVDPDAQVRRKQIEKVLKFAVPRMLIHVETATMSEDGEMFHLQTALDAGMSPVQTEDAMSEFFNSIVQWRLMLNPSLNTSSRHASTARMYGLP